MFSALLLPLVLAVQVPPDMAARDKANAEAVVSQVGEKANLNVNIEAVARELLEKLEKEAQQYPADFTAGQKVIVYSTGPRTANFEFASASDLTDYMMRSAEYLSAGMKGNGKAQQEALRQSQTSLQSLQSRHLAGTVPPGTLQEVISSRWISFPRSLGVMGPIPGRYIYELRSLEQKNPAKGKVGWMDEKDLVLAPPRLLPTSVTPMDRTMRLELYFGLHQTYRPVDDAGANDTQIRSQSPLVVEPLELLERLSRAELIPLTSENRRSRCSLVQVQRVIPYRTAPWRSWIITRGWWVIIIRSMFRCEIAPAPRSGSSR